MTEHVSEPGLLSRYSDWLLAGRSGDRIPVGGEIFRNRPDRPWGPPSLLCNGYRVFPGRKAAGAWRWPHIPSSAEVKERVELYLYSTFVLFIAFIFTWTGIKRFCSFRSLPSTEHLAGQILTIRCSAQAYYPKSVEPECSLPCSLTLHEGGKCYSEFHTQTKALLYIIKY